MTKITLWHGSPNKFEVPEVGEHRSRHDITTLVEGHGFYMIESVEFASSYGNNLYEIVIDSKDITDFTKPRTVRTIINTLSNKLGVPIDEYINVESLTEGVLTGNLSVTKLHKEIRDLLDSEESFYAEFGHRITYEEDCLFEQLEQYFYETVKNVLKYYDASFNKNVYICFRNPENLKIVGIHEK